MNENELSFEGTVTQLPITFQSLHEQEFSLRVAYAYLKTVEDPFLHEQLERVVDSASDALCNLCWELNLDVDILEYYVPGQEYIVTPFRPRDPNEEERKEERELLLKHRVDWEMREQKRLRPGPATKSDSGDAAPERSGFPTNR